MIQSGTTAYFPMYDATGNVLALAAAGTNAKAATYRYDLFGATLTASGSAAGVNPFRFQTQYLDQETGLYYWKNRYYDPRTARWLSRDPAEEDGGLNLYGYVKNDAVNQVDPFGLKIWTKQKNLQFRDKILEGLQEVTKGKVCWNEEKKKRWVMMVCGEGKGNL